MKRTAVQKLIGQYPSHAAAAAVWGVRQPTVSRWANGTRKPGPRQLAKIASAEGLEVKDVLQLEAINTERFSPAYDQPEEMLAQLDAWFAEIPDEIRQKVVKNVMRTIADEAFRVLPMPDSWLFAMRRYGVI